MELFGRLGLFVIWSVLLSQGNANASNCAAFLDGQSIKFVGVAEAIDGDTLWVGIHKVRLVGIDALETGQKCLKGKKRFRCASKARNFLDGLINGATVTCDVERDVYGKPNMHRNRYLGVCHARGVDVARRLVETGWVLASLGVEGDSYREAHAKAESLSLGVHGTEYELPKAFRERKNDARKKKMREVLCLNKKTQESLGKP